MRWHRRGGPQALRDLRDLGHEPAESDYPPDLRWERPVWRLFLLGQSQWRTSMAGAVGLDYTVFLPLITERGWSTGRVLPLLGAIERAWLADLEALDEGGDPDEEDADGE